MEAQGKSLDSFRFYSPPKIKEQRRENFQFPLIDQFSKKAISIRLEPDFNSRMMTASISEEIPPHARLYQRFWGKKIEKTGGLEYSKKTTGNDFYGSLELLVSIFPNGELDEIKIIESSGHVILDREALSVLKMSSPFAPFPDNIIHISDLIEIILILGFQKKLPGVSKLMQEINNLSGHFSNLT